MIVLVPPIFLLFSITGRLRSSSQLHGTLLLCILSSVVGNTVGEFPFRWLRVCSSMADNKGKNEDLYKVLGLRKECNASELRNAYKKLALRWHPDRCSASEESKKKFQAIQEAYSVLSDANRRMMYDVGVYDGDDDDSEMGEFLNEMVAMMGETKPTGKESFEELMELFEEMFQQEKEESGSNCENIFSASSSTAFASYSKSSSSSSKRSSSGRNSGKGKAEESFNLATHFQGFSMGTTKRGEKEGKHEQKKGSKSRELKRR